MLRLEQNNEEMKEKNENKDDTAPRLTEKLPQDKEKDKNSEENTDSKETKEIKPQEEKPQEYKQNQSVSESPARPSAVPEKSSGEYDKYDGQVKTLKNLGYSAQQIIDNLLRLNPELHKEKHVAADIVYKYFPRQKPLPLSEGITMSGGIELTEELKSFIESVLRRQLDAVRNILEEERKRRPGFMDALTSRTLQWGPLLLVFQIMCTLTILLYKGGFKAVGLLFYGPYTHLQLIAYGLLCVWVVPVFFLFFFRQEVTHERQLDGVKAFCYLLLFPVIFSSLIMALDRYKNEMTWNNFLSIDNKDYFLERWYETDYNDRIIFLDRAKATIIDVNTDDNLVMDITRTLIYAEKNFFLPEPDFNYPNIDREIVVYKALLRYDDKSGREMAVSRLKQIISEGKEGIKDMENSLEGLEKCFKENDITYSKKFLHSPRQIYSKLKTRYNIRKKVITSLIENSF